jgi:hypothetical protein
LGRPQRCWIRERSGRMRQTPHGECGQRTGFRWTGNRRTTDDALRRCLDADSHRYDHFHLVPTPSWIHSIRFSSVAPMCRRLARCARSVVRILRSSWDSQSDVGGESSWRQRFIFLSAPGSCSLVGSHRTPISPLYPPYLHSTSHHRAFPSSQPVWFTLLHCRFSSSQPIWLIFFHCRFPSPRGTKAPSR